MMLRFGTRTEYFLGVRDGEVTSKHHVENKKEIRQNFSFGNDRSSPTEGFSCF